MLSRGRPSCPACGAVRDTQPDHGRGGAPRAVVPQAFAAALRLIHALTSRERVIFELLGHGYDNRSISRALQISERTVKRHVTAILGKLNLQSRLQAGLVALIVSAGSAETAAWPGDAWPESTRSEGVWPGDVWPEGGLRPESPRPESLMDRRFDFHDI
ncbi:helix-turn-helix domain-containing protein [Planobispora longispora]|uniref:HTH luxR-type domain-containing protein n=1 Tax=Planobispora longispora TaxID=28887 RepID=A0A8J3W8L5_9ACTN|nr:helix-turn-helix transcriptional regulator [Planobispora longispora]BFE80746.1 hypothetical protein GCM10020093_033470 [Planobispora longispora]GIH80794.1 hypothetical protein Plo01_72230 [Planobispora longispora]